MKKVLSILMVVLLTLGMTGFSAIAATTEIAVDNYTNSDVIELTAGETYRFTVGTSGVTNASDVAKIDSVRVSTDVFGENGVKQRKATTTNAAYVEVTPEYVYATDVVKTTMSINYKMGTDKKSQRITFKLEILPKEVEVSEWVTIENNTVYSFNDTKEVEFDFDYGTYFAKITGNQKDVNLSYVSDVTYEISKDVPSVIDVISFKGKHKFNLPGMLTFDAGAYRGNDRIYVYELVDGEYIPLAYNKAKDRYEVRTQVLGTYVLSDKEIEFEPEVEDDFIPDSDTDFVTDDKGPSNPHDNPSTGR